jgi:hypothetical protein
MISKWENWCWWADTPQTNHAESCTVKAEFSARSLPGCGVAVGTVPRYTYSWLFPCDLRDLSYGYEHDVQECDPVDLDEWDSGEEDEIFVVIWHF